MPKANEKTEKKPEDAPKKAEDVKATTVSKAPVSDAPASAGKHIVSPDKSKMRGRTSGPPKQEFDIEAWKPRTSLGKRVKSGEISDIDVVIDGGFKILESEMVDALIPNIQSDLLLVGQSKGKFGGGQRRIFRQTQKKTKEGNKPSFATYAVVGDEKGHVGTGYGKSRETVPAREKATRKAKLNILKIRRGCGSWQCSCGQPHSIPFQVSGKCGSVEVTLMPAPKGTGLCAGSEIAKILKAAGVEDVWSRTRGKTTSRISLIKATMSAMKELMATKVLPKHKDSLNIAE
jgi:small subunit ribosomal protein S5